MGPPSSRLVIISTGTILRVVAVLATIAVAWLIRDILLIVFTAMLLAGVVYPFAHFAEAKRIPKGITVFIFYLLLFGTILLILGLLVPRVIEQMGSFVSSYDQAGWLFGDRTKWQELLHRVGVETNLQGALAGLRGQTERVIGGLFTTVGDVFSGVVTFFAVLVLSFYMILEESAVKDVFRNLVPSQYQEFISRLIWQMMETQTR
jgi:predicted PurR-regulated permease PerM